jgi:AraC-like DNA-binding protein
MTQFIYTNAFVVDEINRSNEELLFNIQHNIDGIFDMLGSLNTTVLLNDHFQQLSNYNTDNNIDEKNFRYELISLVDRLYVYKQVNPMIDITIYMPQEQYIINSNTANHISYIYGSLNSRGNSITEEKWIDILDDIYRDSYLVSPYLSYNDFNKDSVIFARSVTSDSRLVANIFVSIPCSYIENISGVAFGSFLILNGEGKVIKAFHGSDTPENVNLLQNNGREAVNVSGKSYIFSYVKSNNTNWYYAVLIPKRDFWQKAYYTKASAATSIIIALILGGVSIYWLLKRNYKPVHNVMNLISTNEDAASKNEFDLIGNAYVQLCKENSTMKANLSKQYERSREIYLLSKLKDIDVHLADEDFMEYFQLDFQSKHFALVTFCPNYTEKDIKEFNNDFASYNNFVSFTVNNAFPELLEDKFQYYQLSDRELIIYLFVLEEAQSLAWENELYPKLKQLYQLLQEKYDMPFYITLGEVCDNFNSIYNYYNDIIEAQEYNRMIHKDGGVVMVRDIQEPNHHEDKVKRKYEKLLKDAISLNNYREAASVIDMIFSMFAEREHNNFSFQKFYIYHLIYVITGSYESKSAVNICSSSFQAMIDNITLCPNTEALKKALLNIIKALCGISQEKYDEKVQTIANNVRNYINENYMDCNLCIASIADVVNLNPKYLSRLFKQENGSGLLDYINSIRIQKAKQILASHDVAFEDLAKMVGYTNVRTFRRAFSKIEGTTPSQYKNQTNKS